jgi:glycosyltransferase involved in cell wall biosynthesis
MKVCHCFTTHLSLIFLEGQLQFIQENGVDIHIAIPFHKDIDVGKYPGISFHFIPMVRYVSLIKDLVSLFKLLSLFKKIKFDIIHLHTPKASLLGSLAAKLILHKRIVYHLHGLVAIKNNNPIYGLTNLFERLPFLFSNHVLSVSQSMQEYCITNKLVKRNKIQVLANGTINGIDGLNKFNPNNKTIIDFKTNFITENKLVNKFIVGFVGRICIDKGFFDFLNIANKLAIHSQNCAFLIVGGNELEQDVSIFLEQKAKFQYIHIDSTTNPENYIALLNVLVLPSCREGFGLVAAEASALQIPVVAYDIVGVRNAVVNEVTGKLVEAGDVDELLKAVQFYYANPKVAKEHGESGRHFILNNFNPSNVWQEQLKFYKSIL